MVSAGLLFNNWLWKEKSFQQLKVETNGKKRGRSETFFRLLRISE